MEINFRFNQNQEKKFPDQALVVTSLAYLEDALVNERYEECAELIRDAKRFGATSGDIKKAITDGARGIKTLRQVALPREKAGRKRF